MRPEVRILPNTRGTQALTSLLRYACTSQRFREHDGASLLMVSLSRDTSAVTEEIIRLRPPFKGEFARSKRKIDIQTWKARVQKQKMYSLHDWLRMWRAAV